jgi:hypothetical protein
VSARIWTLVRVDVDFRKPGAAIYALRALKGTEKAATTMMENVLQGIKLAG